MGYMLLVVALGLTISKNMLSKGGRDNFTGLSNLINLNIINGIIAMLVNACFGISFSNLKSWPVIILAILYAVCTIVSAMTQISAMKHGPVAGVMTIFSAGFIITTVYCAIAFNEPISWLSAFGMLLLIVSIVAVVYKKSEEKKKFNFKFLILSIIAMTMSGLVGIIQKYYTYKFNGQGLNSFLFLSFGLLALISLVIRMFYKPRLITNFKVKGFIIPALAYAVVYAVLCKLNLYLTSVLDGVVLFPVLNGGAIAFTALFSFIIFKERLNLRQWMGIFACVLAITIVAVG